MSGTLVFSLIYIKIVQVKADQTEWGMKVDIIKKQPHVKAKIHILPQKWFTKC